MDAVREAPAPSFPVVRKAHVAPPIVFDDTTELFLSNAPTQPEFVPVPLSELAEPSWQPRPTLVGWVVATMFLCVAILASALVHYSVQRPL